MIETYNYWISLLHSGDLDELEMELKEEVMKLTPYMEEGDTPDKTTEEAWVFAEAYLYEG